MPDLLLELFSEEIPARMQARAAEDLRRLIADGLVERGLTYEGAAAHAGPRRLTLDLRGLPKASPARREERKGPRVDAPEKALEGFLRSTGVAREALEKRADKKGEVWFAAIESPGRPAAEIVAETVIETIRGFPWPKSMRWGAGSLRWVRPLHSILCVLCDEEGAEIVPFEIDGIASGATTRGHRFHAPEPFAPRSFEDYAARLERAKVVLDAEERKRRIEHDARNAAFALGVEVVEDPGLLAEVAGLAEWPVTLIGDVDPAFLDLPPEVLRTSMKEHQKFFSLRNPATGRIEKFATVANLEAADGGAAILAGNRRVLAARLSDAKFFWENDLRKMEGGGEAGMAAMAAPLAAVTFHSKLGTQADRVERIAALAREIAPAVGADPDMAETAARICKADLASEMVYEFPELQGTMGRYYAEAAGLAPEIAAACAEHYAPLGPSDAVPTAPVSATVALADKIDMLTGFWAIDEKPTGSKDPFALRRAALGVLRIILANDVRDNLRMMLDHALRVRTFVTMRAEFDRERDGMRAALAEVIGDDAATRAVEAVRAAVIGERRMISRASLGDVLSAAGVDDPHATDLLIARGWDGMRDWVETAKVEWGPRCADLRDFIADRLKIALRDEGVRHDVIDACFHLGLRNDLVLLVARVRALQAFLDTEDGANLVQGYRRAANILTAEEKKDGVSYELDPDPKFAEAEEERALFAALDEAGPAIDAALDAEDFEAAMRAMAGLRAPIDAFFEAVVVNAENQVLRRNRLCLLHRIRATMERVALFSALEG